MITRNTQVGSRVFQLEESFDPTTSSSNEDKNSGASRSEIARRGLSDYANHGVWGVDENNAVWYREGVSGEWQQIIGQLLKQVSVSDDGQHVWGVDENNAVWYRAGREGSFQQITGQLLKQVSVSDDGQHIWGVDADAKIWYRAGREGSWELIDGELTQISVSGNGQHVWGINDVNLSIWYRAGGREGSWEQIDGALTQVSVSGDGQHVWGVNYENKVLYREGESWVETNGDLKYVDVGGRSKVLLEASLEVSQGSNICPNLTLFCG